jgi:biopolymer transport protein TolQ
MTSALPPLRPTLRSRSGVLLLAAGLLVAVSLAAAPALAQSEAAAGDDDSAAPAAAEPELLSLSLDDDSSAWALIVHADPVVKAVILILLVFSLVSWAIILERWVVIRRAWSQSEAFLVFFWKTDSLELAHKEVDSYPDSPVAEAFAAGYRELRKLHAAGAGAGPGASGTDNVGRALRRSASQSLTRLERWIPFLASCGSAAPFIGLFGTVWGILLAFQKIGTSGTTSIAEVGPFIAEALIATAVGLFAAIPAVLFFNYFATRLKVLAAEINHFSFDFLNLIERHQRGRDPGA